MNDLQIKLNELKSKIEKLTEPEKDIISSIVEILESLIVEYNPRMEVTKKITPLEFIKQKKLESHIDKVVGLAYYLFKYNGIDSFTVKDIGKMYEEARLVPPKNFSDIISKASKRGYFIECKEKIDGLKAWKISKDGIEYIESLPEG
jgi:hypothetical protein